ncbi:MAG: hypothetical protein HQL60_08290, partial [Magnetococcales bacterium]|nr:hypothetical protein [Magnetococcales bacterium]
MTPFFLLTLSGRDRPGIVVALTRSLFEAGCHIEDSTMTRLRNELVMMLLLRPPSVLPLEALQLLIGSMANSMDLSWSMKTIDPSNAVVHPSPSGRHCVVSLQGAEQPGI